MAIVMVTAFGVGGATVIGPLLGFVFKKLSHKFSDVMLSFAGGTMLYVVSDEMIPETYAHGHKSYALLVGFSLMLIIDTLLGQQKLRRCSVICGAFAIEIVMWFCYYLSLALMVPSE